MWKVSEVEVSVEGGLAQICFLACQNHVLCQRFQFRKSQVKSPALSQLGLTRWPDHGRGAPTQMRVSRTGSRLVVPMSRAASLLERTENRLTITGSTTKVEAFKQDVCSGVAPASLSFLPRGVLFDKEATSVLTFQRLLPVQ